jgi:hypothetical protein
MTGLLADVAVLAAGLFSGAALYVSLVEHPARMSLGTEIAAREFRPSYKRATVMQASLALVAAIPGVGTWVDRGGGLWLLGSVSIFLVVPFTLIVILPTNNKLLEEGRDLASQETQALLETWGRLHAVRSVLGLLAVVLFVWALGRPPGVM